ncbi:MAG: hypothetical protein U0174_12845 [Polyangiaceae bacterium]
MTRASSSTLHSLHRGRALLGILAVSFGVGCGSVPPRPQLDPTVSLEAIAAAKQKSDATGKEDPSTDPGTSLSLAQLRSRLGKSPKETLAVATEARVVAYFRAGKLLEGAYLAGYWVPISRASIEGIATSSGRLDESELLSVLATLRAACHERPDCSVEAFDYRPWVERDWVQATAYFLAWMPKTARELNAIHPENGTSVMNVAKTEAMRGVLRGVGARARSQAEIDQFMDDLRERRIREREKAEEEALAEKEEARERAREKELEDAEKEAIAALEKAERDLQAQEEADERDRIRQDLSDSIDKKLKDLKDFQKKSNEETLKAIQQAHAAKKEQIKKDGERVRADFTARREALRKEGEARRAEYERAKAEREAKRERDRIERERALDVRRRERAAQMEAARRESPSDSMTPPAPSTNGASAGPSVAGGPTLHQAHKPSFHGDGCRSYAELQRGADVLAIFHLCVKSVPFHGQRVTFVLENLTSSTFYDVAHGSGEVRFSGGAPHRIVSANWCARPPTPGGSTCTSLLQEVDSGRTRTVSDVRLDAPIVRFALDAKSVGRDWSTYGTIIVR